MSSLGTSVTDKKGPYLAFLDAYTRVNGRPPAEADMQRHFRVSPPSVHHMVLTLERAGLIRRQPGLARSIEVLVDPKRLPVLSRTQPIAYVHWRLFIEREAPMNKSSTNVVPWDQCHRQEGSVSGLPRRLHACQRPSSGRGRHAASLPREPSFSSPHGAHPRARRADPATARPRPKHRSVGRPQTPARPIPNPTGQFLRAEELALLWQVCGTEWTLAPCSAEGSRLEVSHEHLIGLGARTPVLA